MGREPFAARLHFIPRMLRRPHAFGVRLIRAYLDRAPGWVLLTTRGRKTGLPRQVVLPCERTENSIIVISRRSGPLFQRTPSFRWLRSCWFTSSCERLFDPCWCFFFDDG